MSSIANLELTLAKFKAVKEAYPDTRVFSGHEFRSKEINQSYTKLMFYRHSYGLWVLPYSEVPFTYEDKQENIQIFCNPKSSRLAYVDWDRANKQNIIRFSRLTFNLKTHQFKDDMLNSCREEIITFVKNNSKYKIDTKHLDPKLKKLLAFI